MPLELPQELSAGIPQEILSDPSIQRYNDLSSVFKGVIEGAKYQGRSVALPAEDAKPEDIDKWKSEHLPKFSRVLETAPGRAADYEFAVEGVDPKVIVDDKLTDAFRATAHKLGLSKTQAGGLYQSFVKEIYPILAPAALPQMEFIEGQEPVGAVMK